MPQSSCEKAAMAARTMWLRVLEIALDDYRRGLERVCELAGVAPRQVRELV
jgi:hypothetical protein